VLLARTTTPETRQLRVIGLATTSAGIALAILLLQAFRQLPLQALPPLAWAALALCAILLLSAYGMVATALAPPGLPAPARRLLTGQQQPTRLVYRHRHDPKCVPGEDMVMNPSRLSAEPLMDATDKLAARRPQPKAVTPVPAARPFGLNFAVSPNRNGRHEKTYYTVTENEATQISRDGVVETHTDQVVRERED
jgi:hypothetical protein